MRDLLWGVFGVCIGAFSAGAHLGINNGLLIRECQDVTGAYECVMSAIPVSLPTWMDKTK